MAIDGNRYPNPPDPMKHTRLYLIDLPADAHVTNIETENCFKIIQNGHF